MRPSGRPISELRTQEEESTPGQQEAQVSDQRGTRRGQPAQVAALPWTSVSPSIWRGSWGSLICGVLATCQAGCSHTQELTRKSVRKALPEERASEWGIRG